MSIEVNGVSLPDIPSEVLESYPYAVIAKVSSTYEFWYLVASADAFLHMDAGEAGYTYIVSSSMSNFGIYGLSDDSTAWEYDSDNSAFTISDGTVSSAVTEVLWANHDICEAALNEAGDALVATDTIYFANSAVDPNYFAPKSWYDGMAAQVRRLTGTSDKLTTDEMLAALKALELTGGGAEMFLVKTMGVLDASVGQLTIDHTPAEMIEAHNGGQAVLFELTAETLSALYGATMTDSFILRPCAFNNAGSYFQFQGVGASVNDTGTTTFTVTSVTCYENNSGVAYCTMVNMEASGYTTA